MSDFFDTALMFALAPVWIPIWAGTCVLTLASGDTLEEAVEIGESMATAYAFSRDSHFESTPFRSTDEFDVREKWVWA